VLLVALSALLWSTAGLFVRMANLDTWTILGWRSLFSAITLGLFIFLRKRPESVSLRANLRAPGLVSIAISVLSSIAYILSLRLTSVANVMTVYAALPFIATAIAYIRTGETVNRRFLICCAATMVGIAVMAGAAATRRDILGIVAAIVMTSGFAAQLVHSKLHANLDMSVIITVAALVCVAVALPFMQHAVPTLPQVTACALYGILTTGIAYVLVLLGGRYISSGEAGFVSLLDVILGPIWVWLVYSESPSRLMLVGGALVLGSVVAYLVSELGESAADHAAGNLRPQASAATGGVEQRTLLKSLHDKSSAPAVLEGTSHD
jgi:drug/metabolite transporter (DMT)-like permease